MKLLKKMFCNHKWKVLAYSNALQSDSMGYPLRLYCMRCSKCGKIEHKWFDVPVEECEKIKTGELVLVSWEEVYD